MIEQADGAGINDDPVLILPDLPTDVGMPGHTIEVEVGGQVCLSSVMFAALR